MSGRWFCRFARIAVAVVVSVLPLGGCDNEPDPPTVAMPTVNVPTGFVEQKSADGAVTLKAPAQWRSSPPANEAVIINVVEPEPSNGASVNVAHADVPARTTPKQLLKEGQAQIRLQLQNFSSIRAEQTTFAGHPAAVLEYTGSYQNIGFRFYQVSAVRGTKNYMVTCTARAGSFKRLRPVFDQIVASVKIP